MVAAAHAPQDDTVIDALASKLLDADSSLPLKYRVLFSLRNLPGEQARAVLAEGLKDPSALLRHEIAYCLGQRQEPASIRTLTAILQDLKEHAMVRHEAAEALGAIGNGKCECMLRQFEDDDVLEVAETCQLALQRIERERAGSAEAPGDGPSPYLSVDPMQAAPADTPMQQLEATLLDEGATLPARYAAMFALRNRGGADAVAALAESFTARSALLKHEVAYVLGQMQDPSAVDVLRRVLQDRGEAAMVRHEAAEALGSIASPVCMALLEDCSTDADPIVAHSCEVALDMLRHEQSGDFQYAAMS